MDTRYRLFPARNSSEAQGGLARWYLKKQEERYLVLIGLSGRNGMRLWSRDRYLAGNSVVGIRQQCATRSKINSPREGSGWNHRSLLSYVYFLCTF